MRAVNKAVVSARRYISNSFKDQEKEQAIDVFLGIYSSRNVALPIWLSDDRSFVWSSQKYYEYCPSRPNRPQDGWWQQPQHCFFNGFQVFAPIAHAPLPCITRVQSGFPSAIAATPALRSFALSVLKEPFSFSVVGTMQLEASATSKALALKRLVWASEAAATLADTLYDSSSDEEYSIDGWGFDVSGIRATSERMHQLSLGEASEDATSFAALPPAPVSKQQLSPAASPDTTAAAVGRDADRPRVDAFGSTLSLFKDTQDFKQVLFSTRERPRSCAVCSPSRRCARTSTITLRTTGMRYFAGSATRSWYLKLQRSCPVCGLTRTTGARRRSSTAPLLPLRSP
jgi:hypothetical protein